MDFSYSATDNCGMELDPARLRLLKLVADNDTDLATVSRAIGRNHAYLQQFVKRGTPHRLPEEVREALGTHFQVDADLFKPAPLKIAEEGRARTPVLDIQGHEYAMLPVFDLRLSAGPGAWNGDDSEPLHYEPFRHQFLRSLTAAPLGSIIVARVDGDSMEPLLRNGDQVLVDLSKNRPTRDGIYGLRQGDEMQVKRIAIDPRNGLLTIISVNKDYPTWPDVDPDSIAIVGRVIWLGRQV